MPVGALIETGQFTLALVWWRLSVPITACEIMCRRFFVVLLQKVLNYSQSTTTKWAVSNEGQHGGVESRLGSFSKGPAN
jgi:hypothetical protein